MRGPGAGQVAVKLVLADGSRLFLDLLKSALVRHGFDVAELVTRPQELLVALGTHQPDICLLAACFPSGSGLDLLSDIGRQSPSTKVIIFSAASDPEEMSAAIEGGAAGYIPKGHRIADIVGVLARVGSGERVFDSNSMAAVAGSLGPSANGDGNYQHLLLTGREREVLMQIMEGEGTRQIARSLAIAESTTRTHVQNVLAKLGVHSRLEAANIVARSGLPGQPAFSTWAARGVSGR
jgi:two-component system, NarL family, nitrate/nitrite response regulator NarL